MNAASLALPPRVHARIFGLSEAGALGLMLLVWLLLHSLTLGRYPLPWVDEIQFADPALRWAAGQGFTSTVWIAQAADAFWAGNAPLFSALLSGWVALGEPVLGEMLAVRSFNLLLMGSAAVFAWSLVRRRGWVHTPARRLLLVALLLCGHGLTFSVRMGRYDVLGLCLALAVVWAWTSPRRAIAWGGLVGSAALLPAAGLALVPATLVVLAIVLWQQGRAAWPRALALLLGLALGAGGLWAFFAWHGVWEAFRTSTAAVGVIGQGWGHKIAGLPRVFTADKSALLLMLAAAVLAVKHAPLRAWLVLALVLPTALQLAGKFPVYYAWMVFVPLAIGVCGSPWPRGRVAAVACLVAGALLVGLPLRLVGMGLQWQALDPQHTDRYAARWLRADDRLVADFRAHYAARRYAQGSFAPTALQVMRASERSAVTAVWVRPTDVQRVTEALGGSWVEAAPPLAAPGRPPVPWRWVLQDFAEQDHALVLMRRTPPSTRF